MLDSVSEAMVHDQLSMFPTRYATQNNYSINHPLAYGQQGVQYQDSYGALQHGMSPEQQAWVYPSTARTPTGYEEWGPPNGVYPVSGPYTQTMPTYSYHKTEYSPQGMGLEGHSGPSLSPHSTGSMSTPPSQTSPNHASVRNQNRQPYDWMKKQSYQSMPNSGKTRTKDKYRVVYSDHQRLELEKEFHYSRYITIRRKAELAQNLALSERQVKIWFQNRRAKERKQNKKKDDMQKPSPVMIGDIS